MAIYQESGFYSINDYVIDFSNLYGTKSENDVIHIKDKTTCNTVETVNLATYTKFLRITIDANGTRFSFWSMDSLTGYTNPKSFVIKNPASYPQNLFRLTYNDRSPGNNTPKWIGSDEIRNGYGTNYKISEFTNLHIANRYLGLRKENGSLKIIIKTSGTSPITQSIYSIMDETAYQNITKHKNIDPYTCVNLAYTELGKKPAAGKKKAAPAKKKRK